MRTMLFLIEGDTAVSATLLDESRDPVDGHTAITVLTALDYLHVHRGTGVEMHDLRSNDATKQ